MICKSCNFENREGALFCAECGSPLQEEKASDMKPMESQEDKTVIIDEVVAESKDSVDTKVEEPVADDSEADTSVLTSNMLNKPVSPAPVQPMAPMGPGAVSPQQPVNPAMNKPVQMNPAGPGMNPVPQMKPAGAPMNQAPQMNPAGAPMNQAPQMNPAGAPMNQVPQMNPAGAPMNQAPQMKPQQMPEESKKGKKAKKAKKEKKMGTGTKVYIVISIILILGLTGVGVWGYLYFTDKLDTAESEKETMVADYEAQISAKDTEISNLNASVTDAQSQVLSLEAEVADYELSLAESQATASTYATYDGLIEFADGSTGDASTELMVSDTVLHLTQGKDAVVQVYFPSPEGQLEYECSDKSVAECTWGEEWVNGNLLPLTVSPKGSGSATITIKNDQNDTQEVIYIYVD